MEKIERLLKQGSIIQKKYDDLAESMFEEIKILSQKNQLLQQPRDLL